MALCCMFVFKLCTRVRRATPAQYGEIYRLLYKNTYQLLLYKAACVVFINYKTESELL